jgi:hypothetical protein
LLIQLAADAPQEFSGIMLISVLLIPAWNPESWRYMMDKIPFRYLLPGSFRPSNTELLYFKEDVISLAKEFAANVRYTWYTVTRIPGYLQEMLHKSANSSMLQKLKR